MHSAPLSNRLHFSPFIALIDFLLVLGSGWLAHAIRFDDREVSLLFEILIVATAVLVVFFFTLTGVYDTVRRPNLFALLQRYSFTLAFVFGLIFTFLVFSKSAERVSRLWLGYFIICTWVAGMAFRVIHAALLRILRQRGKYLRNVLVIATDTQALPADFAEECRAAGFNILKVKSALGPEGNLDNDTMIKDIESLSADEVWLCLPLSMGGSIKDIVYALRHQTADIRYLPDFEDMQLLNHKTSQIAGRFALDISCSPMDETAFFLKRLEDLVLGGIISILIAPVCVVIAIVVKLSSPGPALFKQLRNGIDGQPFVVYKFRTMNNHTEANGNVPQATKNDPRITRIGAFLRRTSLDELPQFFNVFQGYMSIVGPRPHALTHNEYYKDLVESYMWRHKVKPGITGWAQVNGFRGQTDTLEKMKKRVEYDLYYINNWSIWLDLKIILQTIFKGFINKNAY